MKRIDGFSELQTRPFAGYEPRAAARFWRAISWVSERFHVEVDGLENVPAGRGLLVMNHAFGWDATLPMAAIRSATNRTVWALGEHLWWKLPFIREIAVHAGAVDGTPRNAEELLTADELVLVLPGGLREALKPKEMKYRLLWGNRFGFVLAAMRSGAPLVPIAGIGADEVFDVIGDAYARGRKWLHRDFPLPRLAPVIHRPHLRYVIGRPIDTARIAGESEGEAARRLRCQVRGALEELIDEALADRLGLHH